jgi:hypothetical protein
MAAYEHEEEAAPSPVAHANGRGPSPASLASIRSRGTHACTTAEGHLALLAGAHQALQLELLHVVGDECLRALTDPREVAHAQLLIASQRKRQREPRRIGQGGIRGSRPLRIRHGGWWREAAFPEPGSNEAADQSQRHP